MHGNLARPVLVHVYTYGMDGAHIPTDAFPNLLVAAAHCAVSSDGSPAVRSVICGLWSLSAGDEYGELEEISEVVVHPQWNASSRENDLAILKVRLRKL